MVFNLASVVAMSHSGQLEIWVDTYLTSGTWANQALATGLKRQSRWWLGPLEIEISQLQRCCGPEPGMEFRMDPAWWTERTGELAASLPDLAALPPLIIEYRQGLLSVRDGNHRLGALEQLGWRTCWVLIWFNLQADYEAYSRGSN